MNVIKIIYNDFDRLTEFGFGYLFGKIILSIVLFTLAFIIITMTDVTIEEVVIHLSSSINSVIDRVIGVI